MSSATRSWWVGLLLTLVGCRTWALPVIDLATIDRPADAPCDALVADVQGRGIELYISDGGPHFHTFVLADDEALVLSGKVERIRRGGWLTLRRQRGRAFRASLQCASPRVSLELPVRTCRSRGRVYGIVDPRVFEEISPAGSPEHPCRLSVATNVGDEWIPWQYEALLRPSARAQIEGDR